MTHRSGRPSAAAAFGRDVRRLRKLVNLTLEELAERCGVTPNYIGSIENGHRDPSLSTIQALAGGLGVTPRDLFGGGDSLGAVGLEMAELFDTAPPAIQKGVLTLLRTTAARRGTPGT
jgi:XRE family transcriptional regulator, fatty acid utilization regulator